MDDQRAASDRVVAEQSRTAIRVIVSSCCPIRGDLSDVANVTDLVIESSMVHTKRVVVTTSGVTTLGLITPLVDMEAMISLREPSDGALDAEGVAEARL